MYFGYIVRHVYKHKLHFFKYNFCPLMTEILQKSDVKL